MTHARRRPPRLAEVMPTIRELDRLVAQPYEEIYEARTPAEYLGRCKDAATARMRTRTYTGSWHEREAHRVASVRLRRERGEFDGQQDRYTPPVPLAVEPVPLRVAFTAADLASLADFLAEMRADPAIVAGVREQAERAALRRTLATALDVEGIDREYRRGGHLASRIRGETYVFVTDEGNVEAILPDFPIDPPVEP